MRKEQKENSRECSAGSGRAPFEGGLLNFQGHSHGPLARGREKARGRRRRRKRSRGEGRRKQAGWGPTRKLTPKPSKDMRFGNQATDRPTDRPVDQFVSSRPPSGPPAHAIDESRRRASSFPNVHHSRKPNAHSVRNQFSEARQGPRL